MILAEKIAMLRKKNNWPQEELAEKCGVSRQSVSKWESAASIPDLDRILKLSEVFGVSTDFLLKDELEEYAGCVPEGEPAEEVYRVSLDEANSFLEYTRRTAKVKAACIAALIWAFAAGGFLEELARYGVIPISSETAEGIGILLGLTLAGGAILAWYLQRGGQGNYSFLRREDFSLQYGVAGILEKQHKTARAEARTCRAAGIGLCFIGAAPAAVAENFWGAGLAEEICGMVFLVFMTGAVILVAWSGTVERGFQALLETEGLDGEKKKKKERKIRKSLDRVYWPAVTVLYLGISLFTGRWESTWIIWVAAALFYDAAAELAVRSAVRRSQGG